LSNRSLDLALLDSGRNPWVEFLVLVGDHAGDELGIDAIGLAAKPHDGRLDGG
jgi:hypothetical protein